MARGKRVRAACNGLLRDEHGSFLFGFASKLGPCSLMHAELWGVLIDSQLVVSRGFKNDICVEADLLSDECNVFNHVYREANAPADLLAKCGHSGSQDVDIFEDAPLFLHLALLADRSATYYSRGL
ncbi:hypothetical protein RIF29_03904 [Crotalaria pallida]|uniref:RNase H type-1 domain-containing protein n=1 Tax=Crotalaria pallida TaxID=3830 RepID=A0AAN9J0F8_CROPI